MGRYEQGVRGPAHQQGYPSAKASYPLYSFLLLWRHLDVVHLWGLLAYGTHLTLNVRDVRQLPRGLVQHLDELLLVPADLL